MDTKTFNKIYPLFIEKYETFLSPTDVSVPDKINSIILGLNKVGKLTNDVVSDWNNVMKWLMDEGLSDAVDEKVEKLIADGRFASLIDGMFDTLNARVDGFESEIQLKANQTDLEQLSNAVSLKANDADFQSFKDSTTSSLAEKAAMLHVLLNVKFYGAIGDGNSHPLSEKYSTLVAAQAVYPKATALTDEIDTCAIQKAIDSGYKVSIPSGTYMINKTLNITSRSTMLIEGSGQRNTMLKPVGFSADQAIIYIDTSPFTSLEKFQIYSANKIGIGVQVKTGTGNVYIKDFGGYYLNKGIYYEQSSYIHFIQNAIFYGCNWGINSVWTFNAVHMIKVYAGYNDIGMELGNGRTISVDNCHFEGNRIGVKKINGGSVVVSKSYFEANTDNSIQIVWGSESAEAAKIEDCDFYRTTATGSEIAYHVANGRFISIRNNNFQTNATAYAVNELQYTDGKFAWEGNTLGTGMSIISDSTKLPRMMKNIEQKSVYSNQNGIYLLRATTAIDLKSLVSGTIHCFRFSIDSGNVTITLPKATNLTDFPEVRFFFQGTSANTVTFAFEDGTVSLVNSRALTNADANKLFRLALIQAGSSTQYILL